MLSQRRLRLLVIAVVAFLFMSFYYSVRHRSSASNTNITSNANTIQGEASKIQNQKFYRSTLDAMKSKEANHAKTQEKIQNAMHAPGNSPGTGAGAGAGSDAEAQKPAIPKANEDTEEIPIAGRTKMTVPKKQDTNVNAKEAQVASEQSEEEKEREIKEKKEAEAKSELNDILKRAPVIVFSKSYCPHSKRAKNILLGHYAIKPEPFVVELDLHPLGPFLQALLGQKTGRRTVPNVLVSGKSIGGGDDIAALDQSDELASTLRSLGGKWIVEVEHLEVEKGL
ncbi:hypothetical protein N7541_008504 [Penicillium brevicompactum]|uniref:Glutaredoxin domain-containing protein n=1 Tax=Penicillium brevicompactum TaxID=5074 RepID=A0A9W9QZ84_PENBR|nr:hypothetical protein N7541_008504 [Penicillium brevicompactum]